MRSINHWYIALLVVCLCCARQSWATVIVRFDPSDKTVDRNIEPTFTVDIVADIPDPVVGWGLDLTIDDPAIISQVGAPAIGSQWSAGSAPDGDRLVGVAFPNSISGTDILLATITFSADALGETDLLLSITPADLTEGFPLDPTGFADVTFEAGHVTVVPEPITLALLAVGSLVPLNRRRRQ